MYKWLKRKNNGILRAGNMEITELADKFRTPLYIINEEIIRENSMLYHKNFKKFYPNYEVIYAGKAFLNQAVLKIIQQENLSLDAVSGGELYAAKKAEFPCRKIYFHGNNKTKEEIILAIKSRVGAIIVDNENELDILIKLLKAYKNKINIQLRITPGVEPETHPSIKTGQFDSKFGFNPYSLDFKGVIEKIKRNPELTLKGIHCHIGSQILDIKYFKKEAVLLVRLFNYLNKTYNLNLIELNLGGGLGMRYNNSQRRPPSIEEYVKNFAGLVKKNIKGALPKILIEPGRSIIGTAGITVYKVGGIKKAHSGRIFVSVDGGMNDNPRVSLYQAKYTPVLVNRKGGKQRKITIAGRLCETGDILIKDTKLPEVKTGDYIVVLGTGAYNHSMSSNYNKLPRPAVILINKNKVDLITKRETYQDLIRRDVIPPRLNNGVRH